MERARDKTSRRSLLFGHGPVDLSSCFCRPLFQLLLGTYGAAESASENLEAILDRMREDGLEADVKTYNLILDL